MHAVHLRPELSALADRVPTLPLVLVSAPAGSGKSTLLAAWREALGDRGMATAGVDLAPLHADPASFLTELAEEIDRATAGEAEGDGFGASLLRRLPHLEDPDPELLARLLAGEMRELGEPIVIFLDNYHRLPADSPMDRLLGHVLRADIASLHLVVATRGAAPSVATRMIVEGRALAVGRDDLSLRADQLRQILAERGVDLDADWISRLLAQTEGWATGVLLAVRALDEGRPEDGGRFLAELSRHEDLFAYVASELLAGEPEPMLALLEHAALLGFAPRPVLESLAGDDAAPLIDAALGKGLLLRAGRRIGVHQLWEALLRDRLRRRAGAAGLGEAVARAALALERAGDAQRGVALCVELEQREPGVALLERHGLDWVERGLHDNVARWLAALAPSDEGSPDLALVRALLDGRRDPERALDAMERVADHFRETGQLDREIAARHNALILAANENLDDRARRTVLRTVGLRRLIASPELRATAVLFMGFGAALTGRFRVARRLLDRSARHDFSARERGALAFARGQIAAMAGEWERVVELTEENLADPAQRSHGPTYFTLRALRALARGMLGRDVESCLEQLAESRDAFRAFGLAVSEAEFSAFAGRLLLREGRAEQARDAFDRALHVYSELEASEGQANAHSLLARVQRDLGNAAAARQHATTCLEIYDRVARLRRRPWTGALAAHVLAEEGGLDTAHAFVRRHARSLDAPDLPLSQHATQLALARIAELSGNETAVRDHLGRADDAAAAADLRLASPDVGAELLRWSCEAVRRHGLDPAVADRLARHGSLAGEASSPSLRIVTLGGFRVECDGVPIEAQAWRGANAQRLLWRLLVANGRPLSREQLCADFWPDAPPARARGSLRVALTKLRRTLEPGRAAGDPERWLDIDGEHIAFRAEALEGWDVAHWTRLLDEAQGADPERALGLRARAVREYGGPLLPDCFDDWALALRGELEARLAREGRTVVETLLDGGRPDEAAELAGSLLAQDGTDQAAWALRVRSELERGGPAAARRELDRARETLRRELETEPGAALQELDRAITGG